MDHEIVWAEGCLWISNYNMWYKVTAMFTDIKRANEHMAGVKCESSIDDPDKLEGVIAVVNGSIFCARNVDVGVPTIEED